MIMYAHPSKGRQSKDRASSVARHKNPASEGRGFAGKRRSKARIRGGKSPTEHSQAETLIKYKQNLLANAHNIANICDNMSPKETRNFYLAQRAEHLANAETLKVKHQEEMRKAHAFSVLLGEDESAPDLAEMLETEAKSAPQEVVDFLRQNPTRFFTPSEISAAIAKRRGRPNGKNFYTSIYVTCRRLAPDQIIEGERDGVRAYKFKTE